MTRQGARTRAALQPNENDIVLAILEWLDAKYRDWCWVRCEPPAAVRARAFRSTSYGYANWKRPEDAWGDGVADILGIGATGWDYDPDIPEFAAIAFEVKSAKGKQRDSQIAFQKRWEKAGGRYYIVRSIEDVQQAMEGL